MYFTERHQEIIENYVSDTYSPVNRVRLYTIELHPAFDQMIGAIINKYRYYDFKTGMTVEDLTVEMQTFLYDVLEKSRNNKDKYYSPEKGSAFSYFTLCIRNEIRGMIDKNIKRKKKVSNQSELTNDEEDLFMFFDTDNGEAEKNIIRSTNDRTIIDELREFIRNSEEKYFAISTDRELAVCIIDCIKNHDIDLDDPTSIQQQIIIHYNLPTEFVELRFDKIFSRVRSLYFEYMKIYQQDYHVPQSAELDVYTVTQ